MKCEGVGPRSPPVARQSVTIRGGSRPVAGEVENRLARVAPDVRGSRPPQDRQGSAARFTVDYSRTQTILLPRLSKQSDR
jgi:hypothetical protein